MTIPVSRDDMRPLYESGGVLLLDKPSGITSNAAIQAIKRLFGRVKIGHTGTLDPLATGLLPVCLGEATKFAAGLLEADKTYEAVLRLGETTDTDDSDGRTLEIREWADAPARIDSVLHAFRGEIEQVPPMFSALKHKGRALYDYARAGETVERSARRVFIHELQVTRIEGRDVHLVVACSKGTYVRTLAHDIGERLGCGAHLVALRRTRIGALKIEDAVSLDALSRMQPHERACLLRASDTLVDALPAITVGPADSVALLQGRSVKLLDRMRPGSVRLYDERAAFLGVGLATNEGEVSPKRMVAQPSSHALPAQDA